MCTCIHACVLTYMIYTRTCWDVCMCGGGVGQGEVLKEYMASDRRRNSLLRLILAFRDLLDLETHDTHRCRDTHQGPNGLCLCVCVKPDQLIPCSSRRLRQPPLRFLSNLLVSLSSCCRLSSSLSVSLLPHSHIHLLTKTHA